MKNQIKYSDNLVYQGKNRNTNTNSTRNQEPNYPFTFIESNRNSKRLIPRNMGQWKEHLGSYVILLKSNRRISLPILNRDKRLLLLISIFIIYWGIFGCATVGGAGLDQYLVLRSIVEDGDLDLGNQFFGKYSPVLEYAESTGKYVTRYQHGTAMLTLPFYLFSFLFDDFFHYRDSEFLLLQGDIFIHSFMFAVGIITYSLITLILMYRLISQLYSKETAFYTTLIAFFASPLGFYTNAMYHPEHALEAFVAMTAIAIWFENRNANRVLYDMLLGLCLGAGVTVKYIDAVFFPIFLTWYIYSYREGRVTSVRLITFIASFILLAITAPIYALLQYGTLSNLGGYGGAIRTHWKPLYCLPNLLFDPDKLGFFAFNPVYLLAIPGFFLIWKKDRELCAITASMFTLIPLFYGSVNYIGTVSYNTRCLVVVVPPLTLALAATFHRFRGDWRLWVIALPLASIATLLLFQHLLGMRYQPHQSIYSHYIRFLLDRGMNNVPNEFLYRFIHYTNLRLILT